MEKPLLQQRLQKRLQREGVLNLRRMIKLMLRRKNVHVVSRFLQRMLSMKLINVTMLMSIARGMLITLKT